MKLQAILVACFFLNSFLSAQNDTVKLKFDQNKRVTAMTIKYADNENKTRVLNYIFKYNKGGLITSRICTEGMYVDTTLYIYDEKGILMSQNKLLYTSTTGVWELMMTSVKTYTKPDSLGKRFAHVSETFHSKIPIVVESKTVYYFDKSGNLTRVVRGDKEGADTTEYSWKIDFEFLYSKNKNQTAIPDYNFFFEIDIDLPPVKNELISSNESSRSKRPKALADKWGEPEIKTEFYSNKYTYEYDKLGRPVKRINTYSPGQSYFTVYIYE